MAVVPYVFANAVGQIPLSELDVNFANCKAFAETAGNVTGNIQANITSLGTLTALTASGNIVAPNFVGNLVGNISGNLVVTGSNTQVLFNDNGVANATAGMTFNKSSNAFVITGNITGGNLRTAGTISATGNITTSGNIIGGRITGNSLITTSGNIAVATGVLTMIIGNSTPTTVYMGGGASNIYLANANSVTTVAGNLSVGANISATGNITGGNLSTTGNLYGGNLSILGNLSVTGNSTLTGAATAPTAANGTNTTQVATTAFVQNSLLNLLPSGVIVMWSGSIVSIPTGWYLCDGGNSTPDLRNRFVVAAGSTYAVNAIGGSADSIVVSHTHTATSVVTDSGHSHGYNTVNTGSDYFGAGSNVTDTTTANTSSATTGITVATTVNSTGTSGTNANLPPYYALAYIMKA
jgi:hypothetical protein